MKVRSHRFCRDRCRRLGTAVISMILVYMFILTGCNQDIAHTSENGVDEFCTSIISAGPDGHYLLNRTALIKENAQKINDCIKTLSIKNVRVVSNVSGYP